MFSSIRFSTKVVAYVIATNTIFTLLGFVVAWHIGSGLEAVLATWFGFSTVELWALKDIRKEELRKGGNDD